MSILKIKKDCIVIGSGPAGLSGAIYLKRAGLDVSVLSGQLIGGQLTTTTEIENYAGVGHISGNDLMSNMIDQVKNIGIPIEEHTVKKIMRISDHDYIIITENAHYFTRSILIATGASAKYLGLESEQFYLKNGGGVSACATCDGFFYKGLDVVVVGGGDTAFEEAIYLSKIAKNVVIVNRSFTFKASKIMVDRAESIENIKIYKGAIPVDIIGDGEKVTGLKTIDAVNNEEEIIKCDGVFIAIGHKPNTDFLNKFVAPIGSKMVKFTTIKEVGKLIFLHFEIDGEQYKFCSKTFEKVFKLDSEGVWLPHEFEKLLDLEYIFSNLEQIKLDENGYLITNKRFETNWKGVYGAGDVQDTKYRQAITSAGDGCKAAMEIISSLS